MKRAEAPAGGVVTARVSAGSLVASVFALIMGLSCVSLAASRGAQAPGATPVLFVIGAAATTLAYVIGLRPSVRAEPGRVIVRNPWVTYGISWREVTGFQGGARLLVRRRSGSDIAVWAVQKTNLYLMLGRKGRPERVAERLTSARECAAHDVPEGADYRRWAVPWVPLVLVVIVALLSAAWG